MNDIVETALKVAKKYPVFPTHNKKPSWSNKELGLKKGEGGYKIATQDPDRIKELFSHPRATEIAVPMGAMSGLMCIDVDLYKDPSLQDWVHTNGRFLDRTLRHMTRSGGLHFIFKHPGDTIRFPATLRPGVDIKAVGTGYICWPDGIGGYNVVHDVEPLEFPMELLQEAMIAKGGSGSVTVGSAYNEASDTDLIERIQDASDLYPALRTLSFRLPSRRNDDGSRYTETEMVNILSNLMDTSVAATPSHPRHDDWADRREKISHLVETAIEKEVFIIPKMDEETIAKALEGKPVLNVEELTAARRPIGPQRETTVADMATRLALRRIRNIEQPEEKSNSAYISVNAKELSEETIAPVEWIVPGVLPKQNSVGLAGQSNVGKTRFLAALAMGVAAGKTELLGLPPMEVKEGLPVIWIANEERVEDIKRRLKAWSKFYGVEISATIVIRGKDTGSLALAGTSEIKTLELNDDNIEELIAAIQDIGACLCILDPYVTLAPAGEENGAQAAEVIRQALNMIQELTGATTLFAHHTPKGDRSQKGDWYRGSLEALRGSGAIGGALDVCFTLANWWPVGKGDRTSWGDNYLNGKLGRWIVLDVAKVREGERIDPVVFELVGQEMDEGEGMDIGICRLSDTDEALDALLNNQVEGVSTLMIADAMIERLGVGTFNPKTIAEKMEGCPVWPADMGNRPRRKFLELLEHFVEPMQRGQYELSAKMTGEGKGARWAFTVTKEVTGSDQ